MSMSTKPAPGTPTSTKSGDAFSSPTFKNPAQRQQFVGMALTMSWQLAVSVLVPVLGGVAVGKATGARTAWVLIGLGVALIASGGVMWRTVQRANRLPVPKLTAAEKRAVQKSYEEDDAE